jgi:hypothetical protein
MIDTMDPMGEMKDEKAGQAQFYHIPLGFQRRTNNAAMSKRPCLVKEGNDHSQAQRSDRLPVAPRIWNTRHGWRRPGGEICPADFYY